MKMKTTTNLEIEYRAYAENEKNLPWGDFISAVTAAGNEIIAEYPDEGRVELRLKED